MTAEYACKYQKDDVAIRHLHFCIGTFTYGGWSFSAHHHFLLRVKSQSHDLH